ncbi:hypothetical protein IFT43_15100 [Oxalobacteraceae sp. CFBP 13708]|nr:hypothetical protein [Oxalobacteraceae sp. CFBP 13708]
MNNQVTASIPSMRHAIRALIADDAYALTFQSLRHYRAALLLHLETLAGTSPEEPGQFERGGYFCAGSALLYEDGDTSLFRSIFRQGGEPCNADPIDIERSVQHGLIQPAAQHDSVQGDGK